MLSLLELAEAPGAFIRPPHPGVIIRPDFVLSPFGPTRGSVQRIRLRPEDVRGAVEETRALARSRGWTELAWWVSDFTEPAGVEAALGFPHEETLTAMTITSAPRGVAAVEVTRVETVEQFVAAQEIDLTSMGWSVERVEEARPGQREAWERLRDTFMLWLATIDGEAVGFGRAAATEGALMLIGGATLPHARGRGVYRALVQARWEEAVASGRPALLVQANGESSPILARIGFEPLGEIRALVDRF